MKRKLAAVSLAGIVLFGGAVFAVHGCFTTMPGTSHEGALGALRESEMALQEKLKEHVVALATDIGPRNGSTSYASLREAEAYIEGQLRAMGYEVDKHEYEIENGEVHNLTVEIEGKSKEAGILVVGAHYDSAPGTPAANDNGSGVSALLEIARIMKPETLKRTIRFVFFVNEEPPFFQTEAMGSLMYARRCEERRENIHAMLALETIGYYSDEPGSQVYPAPVASRYPDTGNFIAFVGNVDSRPLIQKCVALFREHASFPAEGAAFPSVVPGIGWSDHWSFWQIGVEALMVTDTAPYRYPHYHEPTDTPDKIDFDKMTRVTLGMVEVIRLL